MSSVSVTARLSPLSSVAYARAFATDAFRMSTTSSKVSPRDQVCRGARRVVGAADAMARRRTTHPDAVKISILIAFRFLLTPAARGLGLASPRAAGLGRLGLLVLQHGHIAHVEALPFALQERLVRIVG